MSTRLRCLLLAALLLLPSITWAHRLDEYLQATIVDIEPGEVRLLINLTPGVAVVDQLLPLFDPNHDGLISPSEAAAYAVSLQRGLTVRIDQREIELKLVACDIPTPTELRSGEGIIRVELSSLPGAELAAGTHTLTIENRHLAAVSVYLVNAAKPTSASIQITQQQRNENQSWAQIDFKLKPPHALSKMIGAVVSLVALLAVVFASVWRARGSRRNAGAPPRDEKSDRSWP